MARKLFCEYGPVFYQISLQKEYLLRRLSDLISGKRFCKERAKSSLPVIIKGHFSVLVRKLNGVDPDLQKSKVENLRIAASKLDGILIRPGEVFSFWRLVGKVSAAAGYQPGLTIFKGRLGSDIGGGLCQLANLIHWLVLHSPLTVTEIHHHSDAIFPDENRRVPFGTGTSIFYNNVDYRFENRTNEVYQLRIWITETDLCGELRADHGIADKYRIVEKDHHFAKDANGDYYRNSEIYRHITDKKTGETKAYELLLKNHAKVHYDPALIPPEQIRGDGKCS